MKATRLANASCTRSRPIVRAALGRAGALCAECGDEGMSGEKRGLHGSLGWPWRRQRLDWDGRRGCSRLHGMAIEICELSQSIHDIAHSMYICGI